MRMRQMAALGVAVSEVGLGTWQLGGTEWGAITDEQALATLHAAADEGVTFLDTADIYGLGRSESLIGRFLAQRADRDRFFIATKFGRHPEPGWPSNFSPAAIREHTEASLRRLGVERLDLTQTHCLPQDELIRHGVFATLGQLQKAGKIRAWGASVESLDEALWCLDQPGLASLQIIFNLFRQKPLAKLFEPARAQGVSLIVRLPIASGLLAGKFTKASQFVATDHRHFNCDGQCFNVGETFAGLPFAKGIELVDRLKPLTPAGWTMAQWAIRWCLDFPAVTTVIPGATRPEQARDNARASIMPALADEQHQFLAAFYAREVAPHIRGKY